MAVTALIIMDGFGNGRPDPKSNAIYAANIILLTMKMQAMTT